MRGCLCFFIFFFFNDTATTEIYTLSLHDALPISGGMVVMDEDTCMVDMARRIMHFYAHESCGWCIPCREGTSWLRKTLERFHAGMGRPEDIDLIADLAKNMLGRTFCPL